MVNVRIQSVAQRSVSPARVAFTLCSLLLPLVALVVYVAAQQPEAGTTGDSIEPTETPSVRARLSDDATTFEVIEKPTADAPVAEELFPVDSLDGPPLPLDFDLDGQQPADTPATSESVDGKSDVDKDKDKDKVQELKDALKSQVKVGEAVLAGDDEVAARSPSDAAEPVQTSTSDAPAAPPASDPVGSSISDAPAAPPASDPVRSSISDAPAAPPASDPVRSSISDAPAAPPVSDPVGSSISDAPAAAPVSEPVRISISDGIVKSTETPSQLSTTVAEDIATDMLDLITGGLSELAGSSPAITATGDLPPVELDQLPSSTLPSLDASFFTITKSPFDFSGKEESPTPNWRKPAH